MDECIKKVLLIDNMNLLHRSHYAYPRLTTKDGAPTGAFFGMVVYLKSLINTFKPEHIIVCSDAHRITFRNKIYPAYKMQRDETPEELRAQFEFVERYLQKCNAKFIKLDDYEADDLMGSLATKAKEYGYYPYIVSGDRDLMQLVGEDIAQIYVSNKGLIEFNAEMVEEKLGVRTDQVIDYKALCGDSSDNIPGVKGIGEKTASKLLKEYETLDGIYENIEKLKGKQKENLINDKEDAYKFQSITKIVCDLDLNYDELFTPNPHFSLCTEEAYEFLKSKDITTIFKKEEIVKVPKEKYLELPCEFVEVDDEIHFRSLKKYAGVATKEGLGMYLYSMLFQKENFFELIDMLKQAKENLLLEDEKNIEFIQKMEEENIDLLKALKLR